MKTRAGAVGVVGQSVAREDTREPITSAAMIKTTDVLMSLAHLHLCSWRLLHWRSQMHRCDLATTPCGLRRWWDGREGLDRGDLWQGWNRRDRSHRWERCDGWDRLCTISPFWTDLL
jgi:hypothetical protein